MKCIAWYEYGLLVVLSFASLWLIGESIYRMRTYKPLCRICQSDIDKHTKGVTGEQHG